MQDLIIQSIYKQLKANYDTKRLKQRMKSEQAEYFKE